MSTTSGRCVVCFDSQVRFVMGEGTTLGDLLELQLHRVEDEVKNIVDKAVKELGIEKVRTRVCSVFFCFYEGFYSHV